MQCNNLLFRWLLCHVKF